MAKTYPIVVPAQTDTEATRKCLALADIAKLSPDSLAIISKAAKKPGADAKLKQYQSFL